MSRLVLRLPAVRTCLRDAHGRRGDKVLLPVAATVVGRLLLAGIPTAAKSARFWSIAGGVAVFRSLAGRLPDSVSSSCRPLPQVVRA